MTWVRREFIGYYLARLGDAPQGAKSKKEYFSRSSATKRNMLYINVYLAGKENTN